MLLLSQQWMERLIELGWFYIFYAAVIFVWHFSLKILIIIKLTGLGQTMGFPLLRTILKVFSLIIQNFMWDKCYVSFLVFRVILLWLQLKKQWVRSHHMTLTNPTTKLSQPYMIMWYFLYFIHSYMAFSHLFTEI